MLRFLVAAILAVAAIPNPVRAASPDSGSPSGTYRGRILTERFQHRQALAHAPAALTAERPAPRQDQGNIAIIDTSGGVLAPQNFEDIDGRTLRFTRRQNGGFSGVSEPLAAVEEARTLGVVLPLDDDDAERLDLPFAFPFFGQSYAAMYVGSDGHITFGEADSRTSARSLARAISGPPRIAPVFVDLDPSRPSARVRAYVVEDRAIITWDGVPLYSSSGTGARQIVQAELHANGDLAFHYIALNLSSAVVGAFPGGLAGEPAAVDLSQGFSSSGPGGFAETFQLSQELDTFAAGQSFFRNHDDAYDFLVLFNDIGLSTGPGTFAYEINVRNDVHGIGDLLVDDPIFDFGADFGSHRRLASFVNMGPLTNYPSDPQTVMPLIGENNTLSLLGQETGHRWGVYVDFIDPATGLRSSNLLGRQEAHWNFFFNSNASVMEGNRIVDHGAAANPRFETVETVSRFGEYDQYIMGLRSAQDTPPSFLVEQVTGAGFPNRSRAPQTGVPFNGVRKDVPVDLIIAAEGPRLPDHTVAQREFRYAFVLLVDEGSGEVSAAKIAKLERIRQEWETFFDQAVENRAEAHTELVSSLDLSVWPAAGVPLGTAGQASVSIARPRADDLQVSLAASNAKIGIPGSVTIPAGETLANFAVQGLASGVDVLKATAAAAGYEQAAARLQVLAPAALTLSVVSGDAQSGSPREALPEPVALRVTDGNLLPYAGIAVTIEASGGAQVSPAQAVTDRDGRIELLWTLGADLGAYTLTARLADAPAVNAVATADAAGVRPSFSRASVVSAASFHTDPEADDEALGPGGLASIFGSGLSVAESAQAVSLPLPRELAGVQVRVNGVAAPLLFVSPGQINFQIPFELSGSIAHLVVHTPAGDSETVNIPVATVQPGLFFDGGTGLGAIVYSADGLSPWNRPARAGEYLALYASGLGPVQPRTETGEAAPSLILSQNELPVAVLIDGLRLDPVYAGLAPSFAGLWQVNVQLPADLPPGEHHIALEVDGRRSNAVLLLTAAP